MKIDDALKNEKFASVWERLRPYQKEDVSFLLERGGGLNYLDMRLGKTLETLTAAEGLQAYPLLIVCPKFALYVWKAEIEKWFGEESWVYTGKPKERDEVWKGFHAAAGKVLITNFAQIPEIYSRSASLPHTTGTYGSFWKGFIADEIHMGGLFNHKMKTKTGNPTRFNYTAKLTKAIPHVFLLTGTPYRQGVVDFFAPLHLLARERFASYWSFVNRHCIVLKDQFGKSIERNPKNPEAFRSMIRQYMIRREKKEVFDVPPKQRLAIPVEMNKEQLTVYEELTRDLFAEIPESGELIMTPGVLTLMIRQRQLLVCPQELGLKHRGAAIDTLIDMSHEQLDEGEPIVIYTPFRKAVPFIEAALHEEYGPVDIFKIQGKMTAEEFRDSWQGFQTQRCERKVMICVIKSGAAFQASAANVGYFLGCEWDFNLNEQAEDRMFSPDKEDPMQVYYLVYEGTVDDNVKRKLNDKKFSADWVLSSEDVFRDIVAKVQGKSGS